MLYGYYILRKGLLLSLSSTKEELFKSMLFVKRTIQEEIVYLNVFEAFSKFCKSLESFNSITLLFLNAEHDLSIKFSA